MSVQVWLVRHGETEWTSSGQHTGRTDLPLTLEGQLRARQIAGFLNGRHFDLVLTSPLQRARETCRLSGYSESAIVDANLSEWDYGDYEGRTTGEIRKARNGWSLWTDSVPNGETIERVAARAQSVIDRVLARSGDAILFAHGHILRVLTACWLGLSPAAGRFFALCTASVSTLGFEHEIRVITQWNGNVRPANSAEGKTFRCSYKKCDAVKPKQVSGPQRRNNSRW